MLNKVHFTLNILSATKAVFHRFDTISEIIASMYVENTYFMKDVHTKLRNVTVTGCLHSVLEYCQESFELNNYYDSRASILYRRYKGREINLNKCTIDCQDNARTLLIDLMKLVQIIQNSQCACGLEEERISAIEFLETGLSNLESILKEHWKEKVTLHELHNYIAVDVEFLCEKKNTTLLQLRKVYAIISNKLSKKLWKATFGEHLKNYISAWEIQDFRMTSNLDQQLEETTNKLEASNRERDKYDGDGRSMKEEAKKLMEEALKSLQAERGAKYVLKKEQHQRNQMNKKVYVLLNPEDNGLLFSGVGEFIGFVIEAVGLELEYEI
ncbi:hypothetical protein TSAR_013501 [Trichomalopsis sarcophagae]|uniref:Uncharacterized protein n=1 Tax=Trichomalopsis sarcophagae TaxID=543379 RepID=A0A232EXX2_9HYME|nr:hypothetical protein TSAR_013501 [Trichomalopsis sarcophagae]